MAHGIELEAGDFLVQMIRNDVYLRLQGLVIRTEVFGGERLVGEAHVHYRSGMAFGGGKIDEAAFGEEIDLSAILHSKFVDHGADFALAAGQLLKRWDVNLHIEVPRVA